MKKLSPTFKRAAAVTIIAIAPLLGCRPKETPVNDNDSIVRDLCLDGCPKGAPASDRVIKRPIYTLANNGRTKFADWVAYEVSNDTIGPHHKRVWHRDPDLPADETLSPPDYKDVREMLHADRGHQAPLASLSGSPDWDAADDLSNITPQATALNEGAWERLENAERKLAHAGLTVYSMTGPLYEHAMPSLPHAHLAHTVPSGYWKVIAVRENNRILTAAFIFAQETPREEPLCDGRVTLRTVEDRTHLTFYPLLNETSRQALENSAGALLSQIGCAP